jgi:hypothetical protein
MAVRHLGQITDEIVDSWVNQFEKRNSSFYCKKCGDQIMQTTCYVSVHWKLFDPTCAGGGEVKKINYPFCPKCDGAIEYTTACYHA